MQVGTVDVVVVGAGLSGLICARELDRQGLRVRLLEARSRCGGRMHRCRSAMGLPLDLGGQWVGATHQRLLALLNAFGLTRYPTYYEGEGVFHWNGTAHRTGIEHDFGSSLLFFQPGQLGLPAAELAGALAVQRRFQQLVAQVPPRWIGSALGLGWSARGPANWPATPSPGWHGWGDRAVLSPTKARSFTWPGVRRLPPNRRPRKPGWCRAGQPRWPSGWRTNWPG